jgi:hypothetical protein
MKVKKRGIARRVINWIFAGSVIPRLIRIASITGLLWATVQFADRYGLQLTSPDWRGIVEFSLVVLVVVLATELVIVVRTRPVVDKGKDLRNPGQVFADSLIDYAEALSVEGNRRDQAVLELRGWSSRLLHLTGAAEQRAELGQIALTAATALEDRVTQASILIDDLGWSLHEIGDDQAALENIREALLLIDDELVRQPGSEQILLDLKLKALRHRVNITARTLDLAAGRSLFGEPRQLLATLTLPASDVNAAQLDHSEAELISRHLDREIGESGQVDPTGQLSGLLRDALTLAQRAEDSFSASGDHERVAKVLKLKVRLLAHDTRKQRYREASAKLERLEREVSRNLR